MSQVGYTTFEAIKNKQNKNLLTKTTHLPLTKHASLIQLDCRFLVDHLDSIQNIVRIKEPGLPDLPQEVGEGHQLETQNLQQLLRLLGLHPVVLHPADDPLVDLHLRGKEGVSGEQLGQRQLREGEKALGFHHFRGVHVDERAASGAQFSLLVVAGHVVDLAHVAHVEGGFEVGRDGLLQRTEVVLVGQAEEVKVHLRGSGQYISGSPEGPLVRTSTHLFLEIPQTHPSRVDILQQSSKRFRGRVANRNFGPRVGLLHVPKEQHFEEGAPGGQDDPMRREAYIRDDKRHIGIFPGLEEVKKSPEICS